MFFPEDNTDEITQIVIAQEADSENNKNIKNSLLFDFEKQKFVVADGKIQEVMSIEAIKQWITLFIKTMVNGAEIYEGTKFGNSFRKLKGYKVVGNGFIEAEIEREVREGLLLCPALEKVTYFNLEKQDELLVMYIDVKLFGGEYITNIIEV